MANAKKDTQEKGGRANASAKLSKEMKADIEKMMDKRLSSIEKQLEKLKGSDSKGSNSKGSSSTGSSSKGNGRKTSGKTKDNKANKGKQDSSTKTKKTGGKGKKKSNQRNEDAE